MLSTRIVPASIGMNPALAVTENKAMWLLRTKVLLMALLMLAIFSAPGRAQTVTATLSGFVYDQTGAVVPKAKVTLTNDASKDKRTTVSNANGFFSFTAVPASTYSIKVQRDGFEAFEEKEIELHPADERNLTNIKLQVGSVESTITVTAAASTILTSGERSSLITAEDIKKLPVEGRDVTELIKTLPGFAQIGQGTGADNVGPDPGVVGGQTGNYVANGTPPEGISIISDGVNITDPGNGASSDQVINMDNVQEVNIQTSNFGADSAKGPIVINAVGKSGGSEYHGSLYVHGRTYQLNTQDWFSKYDGDVKPQDRYIYPGGNFGGPVKIPGTDFNHNKKLVFFVSGEDYVQRDIYSYGNAETATINALVPTANMRAGIFSPAELTTYFGTPVPATNCGAVLPLYVNICNPISGSSVSGANIQGYTITGKDLDPGAAAIMNNLVPLPNRAPFSFNQSGTASSIFNYTHVNLQNADSYQTRVKVDYAFSDNAKLSLVYDFQHSNGRNPQQIFYSPQQPFGEINTPGGILNQDFSHTASFNLAQVFTPSLTNEIYGGASLNLGGNEPGKAGAYLSSSISYPYQGIYSSLQYPQLYDYGFDGLPLALFPDYSSQIFQHKWVPNGGDNLTKVFKTHTVKVGFYAERATNNQTDLNVASNGQIQQYYEGPNNGSGNLCDPSNTCYPTPGNYLASFMEGEIQQFNQFNFQTNSDLYYWTVDGYATDSWKYNKKLTMDIGVRIGHVGPWQDAHGLGMAVWNAALYAQQTSVSVVNGSALVHSTAVNPGYTWHAIDSSIPNSGAGSTPLFYSPRFGMAYDFHGNGKTVFRGGIGAYRSHDSWNDVNQQQATAQGQTYATVGGGGLRLQDVHMLASKGYAGVGGGNSNQAGTAGVGFGMSANDKEQPLTYTYSATLSQQVNDKTLFELSYQGSQSSHLLTQYEQGASGDLENINALPIGSFFKPDPLTGAVNAPQGLSANQQNDYRTYPFYTQVNVARHILYSNYNGLQTSLRKSQGRFQYEANYTWSKNLGVLGSYSTGNVIDSANIRPNYGPLSYDRSQIFKATYSYETGAWKHGSALVRNTLNNWTLAGNFVVQSGPDAQRVLGSNLGLGGHVPTPGAPAGTTLVVNNLNYLGTPDVVLQPALTCDPRTGLNHGKHQFINVSCFALPQFGVNGPAEFPYIHTPGYFDTDARLGKDLKLTEKKNLQFQLSSFNVINRANYSFSSKFPTEQQLNYGQFGSNGSYTFPTDFGSALFRFGRRVSEISVKYNF
jgi:hypothetical protein